MLIDSKLKSSKVNGPGERAVIWTNSCSLACEGCWNLHTHAVDMNKYESNISIIKWIAKNAIHGLTFSGGEPMQQAYDLECIMRDAKENNPELSIGMYTGYTEKELDKGNYSGITYSYGPGKERFIGYEQMNVLKSHPWLRLKKYLDFAIMGRFNQQKLDTSTSLRSSTNQKLVLFSERYKESDFTNQQIEFTLDGNGLIQITGFPVGMPNLLNSRDW
jgi:anaerobic ribonucleoside-triphosphate reductase activating protein